MKFLHLVWAGVWRRPGRATLTLLSIVNAFLLFGLLQGFVSGIGSTVADTHADVLITASPGQSQLRAAADHRNWPRSARSPA